MTFGVGIIGAGIVGGGVIKTLLQNAQVIRDKTGLDIRLVHVAELNQKLLMEHDLTDVQVTDDAEVLIADPNVHVVCELIGGIEPAKTFIIKALEAGKNVVTANKMLLAYHGPELSRIALENEVEVRYEAAVAGCIPVIQALRESLAANNVDYAYSILNGTCNYIFTRMEQDQRPFDEVLVEAQDNGFAETPPDLDIEGHDTAHKCQIMTSLCFASEVDLQDIFVEGITRITLKDVLYARQLGYLVKLLAIMRDLEDTIEARVHPTLIPMDHPLASVRNEYNAVLLHSDIAGTTLQYGRGAGRMPTASAVMADIIDIARRGTGPAPPSFFYDRTRPIRNVDELSMRYYLRLTTSEEAGVLGKACSILGNHGVSISSVIQLEQHVEDEVHVVMMTWEARESSMQAALKELDAMDVVRAPTQLIRVL